MQITISAAKTITLNQVLPLYKANFWSAAEKPDELLAALRNSHALITAWDNTRLVGLGNAISDGHLVVYYPHLLVLPHYHGQGIGRKIMDRLQQLYQDFHMQMLTADADAIEFYQKMGFEKAGQTQPMWIYAGGEH